MRTAYNTFARNLESSDHLEDLGIERRKISKWIFNKEGRNAHTCSRQGPVMVSL